MHTGLIKKGGSPLALFCGKEKIPERGIERAPDFKDYSPLPKERFQPGSGHNR